MLVEFVVDIAKEGVVNPLDSVFGSCNPRIVFNPLNPPLTYVILLPEVVAFRPRPLLSPQCLTAPPFVAGVVPAVLLNSVVASDASSHKARPGMLRGSMELRGVGVKGA